VGLKRGRIKIAKVDIAALLALVAALISGVGDVVRQRAAQETLIEQHVYTQRRRQRWLGTPVRGPHDQS